MSKYAVIQSEIVDKSNIERGFYTTILGIFSSKVDSKEKLKMAIRDFCLDTFLTDTNGYEDNLNDIHNGVSTAMLGYDINISDTGLIAVLNNYDDNNENDRYVKWSIQIVG